jgi:hypothetical protein
MDIFDGFKTTKFIQELIKIILFKIDFNIISLIEISLPTNPFQLSSVCNARPPVKTA